MLEDRVIEVRGLEVDACIGVPDEERAIPQKLLLDLRFTSTEQPHEPDDEITWTIDYHDVVTRAELLVAKRPRKLIETLADELSAMLIREFPLAWVEVTVRKFILPRTEWVGVTVRRLKSGD